MKKLKGLLLILSIMLCGFSTANATSAITYLEVLDAQEEGRILLLNDGSEWDVKPVGGLWKLLGWNEKDDVSGWTIGDKIQIQYASFNLFDSFLLASNLSKKEAVWISPKRAPDTTYLACLSVLDLNKNIKRITLTNGMTFEVKYGELDNWKIGDPVTVVGTQGVLFPTNYYIVWNRILENTDNAMLNTSKL